MQGSCVSILILALFITAVISYLLGSCNSAIIVVRLLKKKDIREYGSHNAGLTNTLRCFGKFPALLTLIGDLLKGSVAAAVSILLCNLILGKDFESVYFIDTKTIGYFSGMFSILGHIFPLYYGFKGGKGVLVASSILLVIDPVTFCIVIPLFLIVTLITKYVSVGSITAAVCYPIITFFVHMYYYRLDTGLSAIHTAMVAVTSVLLIYMHRTNIRRLIDGTENKIGKKKSD